MPPTVSLTSPANGATFTAPASITLTATAADSDGAIQKVEFFHGGTNLIATVTTAPYSIVWGGVPQGNYTLTAVATDNLNVTTTSASVNVTVNHVPALHFVEVDHVNTPRLVANQAQQTVWQRDSQEPFGDSLPDENPSGLGAFEFPLGFPGQYFDKETGNWQNGMRDYASALGRYVQSDPIGLAGGMNTYSYVDSDPLRFIDPRGLYITSVHAACMQVPEPCLELVGQIVENTSIITQGCVTDESAAAADAARELADSASEVMMMAGPVALISKAPSRIISRIKESPRLVREAAASGRSVQRSIDHLTQELSKGNLNPGIRTKSIGQGISEARARDGARVYFRITENGIEILGKSTKANQDAVIREVLKRFGQ